MAARWGRFVLVRKRTWGLAGIGSASHFGAERLLASAGISVQHIAFKGAPEAITDIVAGRRISASKPLDMSLDQFGKFFRDNVEANLAPVSRARPAAVAPPQPYPSTVIARLGRAIQ